MLIADAHILLQTKSVSRSDAMNGNCMLCLYVLVWIFASAIRSAFVDSLRQISLGLQSLSSRLATLESPFGYNWSGTKMLFLRSFICKISLEGKISY